MERSHRTGAAALGGPAAGLAFVAGVAAGLATAAAPYPRPGAPTADVQAYFQGSGRAARLSVAGLLASAAALLPSTVAVTRLAGRAGPGSRAVQTAAGAGGGLAVAALGCS